MAAEKYTKTTTTKRTVKGTFVGNGQIEVEVDNGVFETKNILDIFADFDGKTGEFTISEKTEEDLLR